MDRSRRVFADLNLLRVFLTIWDTRSLTLASHRLGLTQPAVSHALRRLRETFDDPLFVRATGGMVPTDAATQLYGPVNEAFQIIQRAVRAGERFDPASAQRAFRLAMSDVSELYFLPLLMPWLAETAPMVHLEIVRLDPATVEQAMRVGEVDLALGFLPGIGRDVDSRLLFRDSFVCLVRAGHPVTEAPITDLEATLRELRYAYANTSATGHQRAEQWLTEIGIRRRIVLRLGHFTLAPHVVRATDLAVIFPESVARLINADDAFRLLPLPDGRPVIDIMVHAHVHFRSDPGIGWLRDGLIAHFAGGALPPG